MSNIAPPHVPGGPETFPDPLYGALHGEISALHTAMGREVLPKGFSHYSGSGEEDFHVVYQRLGMGAASLLHFTQASETAATYGQGLLLSEDGGSPEMARNGVCTVNEFQLTRDGLRHLTGRISVVRGRFNPLQLLLLDVEPDGILQHPAPVDLLTDVHELRMNFMGGQNAKLPRQSRVGAIVRRVLGTDIRRDQ